MRDIGKSFSFAFKDRSWVSKFVIAALFMILSILLVGIFFLAGYLVQVTQRVMRGEEQQLPDWDDLGTKFLLGLKYCIVYCIYLLPLLILLLPMIPLAILGETAELPDELGMVIVIYSFAIMLLVVPYSLAFSLLVPIITYRFAERGMMTDALDVGRVFKELGRNWQNTLVVALIAVGIQSFASVGLIFFFVGIFFTIFYSYLVSAHMCGLLYRDRRMESV